MDTRPSIPPSSSPLPAAAAQTSMASPSSSADSSAPGLEQVQAPSRRRLVKASMRAHPDEGSTRKRDGAVVGSAPPGFAPPGFGGSVLSDRGQNSVFLTNSGAGPGSTSSLSGPVLTSNVASGFRERDRGSIRSSNKDIPGDYQGGLPHGSAKPGRPPHISTPGAMEARPLGRRAEGFRRHDSSAAQKHGEEIKLQQAKRAALVRAQQASATGNFKSFESPFGNFLVPVIPMQFLSKSQSQSNEMG